MIAFIDDKQLSERYASKIQFHTEKSKGVRISNSAAYFWPADQAQIYWAFKKLVEDGCVELPRLESGTTVDRKVYAITEKGRQVLHDWIVRPKTTDFISRLLFIMHLFFPAP